MCLKHFKKLKIFIFFTEAYIYSNLRPYFEQFNKVVCTKTCY